MSLSFFNSSTDNVNSLPIFLCSESQSLKSYLDSLSFHEIRSNHSRNDQPI